MTQFQIIVVSLCSVAATLLLLALLHNVVMQHRAAHIADNILEDINRNVASNGALINASLGRMEASVTTSLAELDLQVIRANRAIIDAGNAIGNSH